MRLGREFTIADLRREGYKAIFLGIGLPKGRKLHLPGAERDMVYDGMDFLRAFNEGKPLPLGRRIVVIGGGNVAYDVARSAVRPDASMSEAMSDMERGEQVAYDVARSALRMSSDKEVHVVCLESRERDAGRRNRNCRRRRGRASTCTIRAARRKFSGRTARVTGLRTVRCTSVFDAQRPIQSQLRRKPTSKIFPPTR